MTVNSVVESAMLFILFICLFIYLFTYLFENFTYFQKCGKIILKGY